VLCVVCERRAVEMMGGGKGIWEYKLIRVFNTSEGEKGNL